MKKVMVFSDWFAPGYKAGGPIQSLVNLTTSLIHCQFYVVTSDTDHHDTEPYLEVESNKWIAFRSHIQVIYLSQDSIQRQKFAQLIQEIEPDIVYLNSMFSPRFTLAALLVIRQIHWKGRLIVAPRGMLKRGALAEKSWKKKIFLKVARWRGWYNDVLWHATNAQEVDEIRQHFGKHILAVISDNLPALPQSHAPEPRKQEGQLRLLCVARISPEKGIEEALRFLATQSWNQNLTVDFIGARQNETFLRKCEEWAKQIKGAQIRFLGEESPAALEARWAQYDFMYLPTRGENFGHAIAESLNHGVPVIISDRTPWRGLSDKGIGWDLPLEAAAFAPVLAQCLTMSKDNHFQMSLNAWHFAQKMQKEGNRIEAASNLFTSTL